MRLVEMRILRWFFLGFRGFSDGSIFREELGKRRAWTGGNGGTVFLKNVRAGTIPASLRGQGFLFLEGMDVLIS